MELVKYFIGNDDHFGALVLLLILVFWGVHALIKAWRKNDSTSTKDMINRVSVANRRLARQNDKLRARIAHMALKKTLGV